MTKNGLTHISGSGLDHPDVDLGAHAAAVVLILLAAALENEAATSTVEVTVALDHR